MATKIKSSDLDYINRLGITDSEMVEYRKTLLEGFPFVELADNAIPGRDIKRYSGKERESYIQKYQNRKGWKVLKFVPASGAASRMFRELFSFLESDNPSPKVQEFLDKIDQYPFYQTLRKKAGLSDRELETKEGRKKAVKYLLSEEGLNYGNYPKGMIEFHRYPDGTTRTAFEEHFHEAVLYAKTDHKAYLHFTIPEDSQHEVQEHLNQIEETLEVKYGIDFIVETSLQKPSTDTPAIYSDDDEWVRIPSGDLLFRPAGHGALLENLDELDADLVFVKNIDNVVPDRLKDITVENKELLAGVLMEVKEKIDGFLNDSEQGRLEIEKCRQYLSTWFSTDLSTYGENDLVEIMHRPLRVCGMVKNEGEPGGGPFLVKDKRGTSLQIIEKAQIDPENAEQQNLLEQATHFNPVDLVLSLKDHKGQAFDLLEFRNAKTGMVVDKTFQGKSIKALELPGLWNGAMHYWNTIFVEVPIETFNPVKTVFDLLRPNHR